MVILLLKRTFPAFLELHGLGDLLHATSAVAFVAVTKGKHLYFVMQTNWFGNIYESADF